MACRMKRLAAAVWSKDDNAPLPLQGLVTRFAVTAEFTGR
jgi:hypothetical protein